MGPKKMIFAVLVAALIAAACSSGDSESADGGASAGGGLSKSGSDGTVDQSAPYDRSVPAVREELGDDSADYESGGTGGSAVVEDRALTTPSLGPNVIKTADIRLEIPRKEFRAAVQDVMAAAQARGGFVLSSEVSGNKELSGSVVVRVPAESFEATLGELKGLGELTSETVSGQDVSEEFVDLQARLRNLEAQETVLLRLMDRATTVSGTIKVQRELSGIQLEIERFKGRLRFLEDQTTFSTIRAQLVQADVVPPKPAGALSTAWDNARDTFVGVVSGVIVGAGFVLPIGVLLALLALAVKMARPLLRPNP